MKFTETEVKYLAGLMDADGSLFFHFMPYKDRYNVSLKLVLQQSLSIDRDGRFLKGLAAKGGNLQFIKLTDSNPNWSDANRWVVSYKSELNMLIPRLTKHMVIKAKHWQYMLDTFNQISGCSVSEEEMHKLKKLASSSRRITGPLKPKIHPTWAWVSGYLDGDGCYYMRSRKKGNSIWKELQVTVTAHDSDTVGLELLHKAFNGRLRKNNEEATHTWTRSLGIKDRSFAITFLRKVLRHSKLKGHKIEQLLHYHQQRLTESDLTG